MQARKIWLALFSTSMNFSNSFSSQKLKINKHQKGMTANLKLDLLKITYQELEEIIKSYGQPKYRAKQIQHNAFDLGQNFENMASLPISLRKKLSENFDIGCLRLEKEQISKDGTIKRAYALSDNNVIETVLMSYSDGRKTACISSQAGCAMGCVFCATGQMGLTRQLTSSEIFEQAFHFSTELKRNGERLSNVVLMGMGEPLANYSNVLEAVKKINKELGIGARHITISTVGVTPKILKLADEDFQVKLAVSLHSANDKERSTLLPLNNRFPLKELIDACKYYTKKSGRRMTFEWALIHGKNDTIKSAQELGNILSPLKGMCHVNLIPLNITEGYRGNPTEKKACMQFISILENQFSIPTTFRVRRGIDIDAGCGQLTTKVMKERQI